MNHLLAAAALLALVGCSSSETTASGTTPSETTLGTESAIRNGTNSGLTGVGYLYNQTTGMGCTGTVVQHNGNGANGRCVLTAAHCLAGANAGSMMFNLDGFPPPTVATDRFAFGIRQAVCEHGGQSCADLGIVWFADEPDLAWNPRNLNFGMPPANMTVAGYGRYGCEAYGDEPTCNAEAPNCLWNDAAAECRERFPRRREGANSLKPGSYYECDFGARMDLIPADANDQLSCKGDSGGPALNGAGEVVGISVWGPPGTTCAYDPYAQYDVFRNGNDDCVKEMIKTYCCNRDGDSCDSSDDCCDGQSCQSGECHPTDPDAGEPEEDASVPELDSAVSEIDGGAPEADAGVPEADASAPEPDAAVPEEDGSAPPETDAGYPELDAF